MLTLPPSVRIWACTSPVDLRKSFDGLAQLVRQVLAGDPLSGHLFVFRNKSGDRLKVLCWDRDGLVIYYKRNRVASCCRRGSDGRVELRAAELAMILDGIEVAGSRRQHRYQQPT